MSDTTLQGVSEEQDEINAVETGEETEAPVSPRDQKRSDIVANARKAREEETTADEASTSADEVTDHGKEPSSEDAGEGSDELVTIKVDGEEIQVPKAKIEDAGVRTLQKESAADKRLREAAEQKAELDRRAEEIDRREQELAEREQTRSADTQDDDLSTKDGQTSDEYADLAKELYSGDEERAAAALKRIAAGNNAGLGEEEAAVLVEEATVQAELRSAQALFANQFPEIVGNQDLFTMADQETAKLVAERQAEGKPINRTEIILEAGRRTRQFLRDNQVSDPADRKRDLAGRPKTAGGRLPAAPEQKPKTKSQIVADKKRARGRSVE